MFIFSLNFMDRQIKVDVKRAGRERETILSLKKGCYLCVMDLYDWRIERSLWNALHCHSEEPEVKIHKAPNELVCGILFDREYI